MRPVLPITVSHDGRQVTFEVLVDSGADICLFDAEIAQILGLANRDVRVAKMAGITGHTADYYIHDVEVSVGGWSNRMEVGFAKNAASGATLGVVGQKGFFETLVVKFDFSKKEIELKPNTK